MSPEGGKMPAPPKEVLELKDDWKKFIDLVPVKKMNREKKAKQIAHLPKGMEKTFANVNLRMGEVRHRLCLLPYPMRHGSDREQTYWPALRFKDEHEVHYFGKCLPEVFGHKAFENRLFAYVVSRALQDDEENNENSVVPPGHAIYRLLGDPDGKFLIIPTTKEKLAFDYVFFWENISPMLKRNNVTLMKPWCSSSQMLFPSNYQGKLRIASAQRERNKRGKETNHKLTTARSNKQCCAMKETLTKTDGNSGICHS
jgi:hypothetical protein